MQHGARIRPWSSTLSYPAQALQTLLAAALYLPPAPRVSRQRGSRPFPARQTLVHLPRKGQRDSPGGASVYHSPVF